MLGVTSISSSRFIYRREISAVVHDGPFDWHAKLLSSHYTTRTSFTNCLLLISIHWVDLHAQLQIRGLDPLC